MNDAGLKQLITAVCDTVLDHADELTALDQAIGDGDHGINMKRGFQAVQAEADTLALKPVDEALKAIGSKLVMTVGGASGPLYGTLFLALGKNWTAAPDRADIAAAMRTAIDAVAARGKSQAGQKTLLDVLEPALAAFDSGAALSAVADAADKAAMDTVPMLAIRGRASFLGARSIGHMDPGARSSALIIRAIAQTLEQVV
ncbi:MAG: dihydroxyacetone kinase subunit DhaL [Rhizobiaceae bacterium]